MSTADAAVRRESASPYGEWAETDGVLMSYRYLASRPRAIDRDNAECWIVLRHDLRTAAGAMLAAPLSIGMLDTAGINIDCINILALTHIDMHIVDPGIDVREVYFRGFVTKEARSQVFTEVQIADSDDHDRVLGFGTANWSVIVPTGPGFAYPEPGAGIPDSPDAPPLWKAYTGRRRDDGRLEIPGLTPEIGTMRLHHGPMLVVSEAAAIEAAVAEVGADRDGVRVEHLGMSIVNPGRTGPFVATVEVLAGVGGTVGCRVTLRDEGYDDRIVARSFVRLGTR